MKPTSFRLTEETRIRLRVRAAYEVRSQIDVLEYAIALLYGKIPDSDRERIRDEITARSRRAGSTGSAPRAGKARGARSTRATRRRPGPRS